MNNDINLKYIETIKSLEFSQSNEEGAISANLDCAKYSNSNGDIIFVVTQKLNLISSDDHNEPNESFTAISDLERAIKFFDSVANSLKIKFSN